MKNKIIVLLTFFVFSNSKTKAQCIVNAGNDTALCSGQSVNLAINLVFFNDSITITYDATMGQSQLIGENKVYLHSGAELHPFGGWQYTKGNWGMDDSIGLMKNIGTDLWQITLEPISYFGYPSDSTLNGIFMVFRNSDGTKTGKDNTGNDIWMDTKTDPPTNGFSGVAAQWKKDAISSIQWSNGSNGTSITVNSQGNYSVIVTDTGNCMAYDTVFVSYPPEINLGNDTAICTQSFPFNLNAGAGFSGYLWNGVAGLQNFQANSPGVYGVTATTANGCTSSDEISVLSGINQSQVFLGNDTGICGFGTVILNAGLVVSPLGDSLVIQYDATKGQSQLIGSSKVYMHGGAELHTLGGWQYVTGNWGIDDSIGLMKNIGTDLWQITIKPQSYFNYPPDSSLNGVFMVFRNEDGTKTGKDASGNDIWMDTKTSPPTNGFIGVNAEWTGLGIASLLWSDSSSNSTLIVSNTGIYFIQVTDMYGCSASDTISVGTSGLPFVDIGNDKEFCYGNSIVLDADTGFTSYLWSTGDTGQTITIDSTGIFSVTVTNPAGCTGIDIVSMTAETEPVANFSFISNGLVVDFTGNSQNDSHFYWHFFGTNFIHDSTDTSPTFTYTLPGNYNVMLVVSNSCGSDTSIQSVSLVGFEDAMNGSRSFAVYPNPGKGIFNFVFSKQTNNKWNTISVFNILGEKVFSGTTIKSNYQIDFTSMEKGIYFAEVISGGKKEFTKIIVN